MIHVGNKICCVHKIRQCIGNHGTCDSGEHTNSKWFNPLSSERIKREIAVESQKIDRLTVPRHETTKIEDTKVTLVLSFGCAFPLSGNYFSNFRTYHDGKKASK